jgi:hypothetical protein
MSSSENANVPTSIDWNEFHSSQTKESLLLILDQFYRSRPVRVHLSVPMRRGNERTVDGLLHAVDPERGDILLLQHSSVNDEEAVDSKRQDMFEIVIAHAITHLQLLSPPVKNNTDELDTIATSTSAIITNVDSISTLTSDELERRRSIVRNSLQQHRIPFSELQEPHRFSILDGRVTIVIPYDSSRCFISTDDDENTVAQRIRTLLKLSF